MDVIDSRQSAKSQPFSRMETMLHVFCEPRHSTPHEQKMSSQVSGLATELFAQAYTYKALV
jgi:hypothetical protein